MDAQLTRRIQFLEAARIGRMKHSERGLLQHLLGTHALLGDWGAFANTLEATPRLSWSLRRACRAYLRLFRRLAMPGAQRAFSSIEASWWELWR